jgi:hypothetical protein
MATIVTRSGKGSPLTNTEVDANFTNLNTDKAELSGAVFTGAITTNSTIDGRDVAADGTKLDGIEASATADQTGAQIKTAYEAQTNAFTDAQFTKLGGIEASATADQTDAEIRAAVEAATDSNVFTDADHTKLNSVEASADVTDATNVTAAGALMDSELTSIASVKALNQGVATGDSPTFAAVTSTGEITANGGIALGDNDFLTFGASDDLRIYHQPADDSSYIRELGAGNLKILGDNVQILNAAGTENQIFSASDGGVTLYHNGFAKIASTATGIDVTGTAMMDGLTVQTTNGLSALLESSNSYQYLQFKNTGETNNYLGFVNDDFTVTAANKKYLQVENGGDISFYNSAGSAAKMVWDASAEDLQIGGNLLNLSGVSSGTTGARLNANGGGMLRLASGGVDALYVVDGGNVGIGVVPSADSYFKSLEIGTIGSGITGRGAADTHFMSGLIWDGASTQEYTVSSVAVGKYQITNGIHYWATAPAGTAGNAATPQTNMMLDASGNLLVGKTVSDGGVAGHELRAGSFAIHTRDNGPALYARRLGAGANDNGPIQVFENADGQVGSIGTPYAGELYIGGSGANSSGLLFTSGNTIQPRKNDAADNGNIDLGTSGNRFKDLYLSSGVYLGGTGAANKLDDYEEVTFNAVLRGSTSEPSNLLQAIGKATKIGRVVQYSIGFENVYTGGYAGAINIYGLPFANKGARAIGSMVGYLGLTFTDDQAFSVIEVNATTLSLKSVSSNSVWNNCTHNAGSGRYFWLTGTYVTT